MPDESDLTLHYDSPEVFCPDATIARAFFDRPHGNPETSITRAREHMLCNIQSSLVLCYPIPTRTDPFHRRYHKAPLSAKTVRSEQNVSLNAFGTPCTNYPSQIKYSDKPHSQLFVRCPYLLHPIATLHPPRKSPVEPDGRGEAGDLLAILGVYVCEHGVLSLHSFISDDRLHPSNTTRTGGI